MTSRANIEHDSLRDAKDGSSYIEHDFWNFFQTTKKQREQLRKLGFVRSSKSGVICEVWDNSEGIETLTISHGLGICIKYFVSAETLGKLAKILKAK